MGTGGDPHRAFQGLPLPAQLGCTLQQLRIDGQVELDRAGDLNGFRPRTQLTKTLGLGLGLHREQAHLAQHRPGQLTEAAIAPGRTFRQSSIGQGHGNPPPGALMDMVGPELGFHDHCQLRPDPIKKTLGGARQVVRQIAVLDARFVGEQRLDALRAGRRHAGHGDRQLWVTLQQGPNHRRGGNAFAHRHRMYPDPTGLHRRHPVGETLADALGIGRRLARAQPQPNRHQWQPQVKQRGVESSIHGGGVYRFFRRSPADARQNVPPTSEPPDPAAHRAARPVPPPGPAGSIR
ncbi:hypothetical protein D3C76_847660 [compost metagenome]